MARVWLFRVIVPVSDIEKAQSFYAHVLEQPGRRVSPGRHYFDCRGIILACFDPRADGDPWDARSNPECLYIAVDDLEACCDRVRSQLNVEAAIAIETRPWGERSFYCLDPFENQLCFVDEKTVFTGAVI